jgi:predicted ATPase
MVSDGQAVPWVDPIAFALRTIAMALADREAASGTAGWVFFDRGLIDAAAALQHLTGKPASTVLRSEHRYHRLVFLAPPWPEIYLRDEERRHTFDASVAEYQLLVEVYPSLGYDLVILPKVGVSERAGFVLNVLGR